MGWGRYDLRRRLLRSAAPGDAGRRAVSSRRGIGSITTGVGLAVVYSSRGAPTIMQSPTTGPALSAGRTARVLPTFGGRYFALAILFSMNLLNYVDRYSFFAVGTYIQHDLKIGDKGYGVLSASFMIVYTLVTPMIGWLGDRYNRRVLLASGVGLWSIATVGTAFSHSFAEMFFWRALLGLGEATYGSIAPALLSDLFSPRVRGRVIGLYFLALPLGGALGYAIGGGGGRKRHQRGAVLGGRPPRPPAPPPPGGPREPP